MSPGNDFGRHPSIDADGRAQLLRLLANSAGDESPTRQRIHLITERRELLDDMLSLGPRYKADTLSMNEWIRYYLIFTLFSKMDVYTDDLYEEVSQKFGDKPEVREAFNNELETLNQLRCIQISYEQRRTTYN